MADPTDKEPKQPPPPGVPLDQTKAPVDYEGRDSSSTEAK